MCQCFGSSLQIVFFRLNEVVEFTGLVHGLIFWT